MKLKVENNNWQKIEAIFHNALNLERSARRLYMQQACEGNDLLFSEVESLIVAFDEKSDFMDEPVFDLGLQFFGNTDELPLVGQTIGSYKIKKKIGSGGMGDVYLAEDTNLNRKVALKFISHTPLGDEWRQRQLIREAKAIAMLDHPNICTIHGVEETGEFQYIVMQYIEGETLSSLISRKEIKSEQVLPIATQLVEALSIAHAHGIIHRDIKPGNIIITPNGQVKVLDFGLAKIIEKTDLQKNAENTSQMSQQGLILGTVAYMSPEQLRAEELDFRSDIFSLGTTLAELATFHHPFRYESNAEIISAILLSDAQYDTNQPANLPKQFHRIVKKCLEKDKEKRYQSALDLFLELQTIETKKKSVSFHTYYFLAILGILAAFSLIFVIYVYQKAANVRTLAVLPFVNQSADDSVEYLSDGMAEDLITRLSRTGKLKVKPFNFVSVYKGSEVDSIKAGRELGVDAVLTGRITRVGNQFILNTKLIDTTDGTELWSTDKTLQDADRLILQTDISERVISKLQPWENNSGSPANRPSKQTNNAEALNLYWKGQYFLKMRSDKKNIPKAIDFFNQAIEVDPSYARAYAGLADSYVQLPSVAYGETKTKEAMAAAKAAAKQALAIDGQSPEAHTSLGVVLLKYDWNWAAAEKEFRQAIELDPEYAPAHYWCSLLLSVTERSRESIAEAVKARELDPLSQVSRINLARTYYYAGRYDEALQILTAKDQTASERKTNVRYMLGLVYIQKKMFTEAIQIFQEIYDADKSTGGAMLGYCLGKTGKKQAALNILTEREQSEDYFPDQEKAMIYIGLNERKKALTLLDKAFRERYAALVPLKVEPLFLDLRNEPEYINLIREMGL